MRQFDNKERAFLVKKFSDLKSCVLVQRACRAAYKGIRAPNLVKLTLNRQSLNFRVCRSQRQHRQPKRLEFANWFLSTPTISAERIICTDEAYFYLTPALNKQNNRLWLTERPTDTIEKPLHDQKVLIFCAISVRKKIGLYFLKPENVNQHNYLQMLKEWLWTKVLKTDWYNCYYFQQDGAKPHTAKKVQSWLLEKFGEKFMDKNKWPPRSPDLNPCHFFMGLT